MTTVTLSIDEYLLERAAGIAADHGMSTEDYLSRLLHVVTQPPLSEDQLSPKTRQLKGMLGPMTDEERDRAIFEYRKNKYGQGLDIRFDGDSDEADSTR